MDKSKDKGPAKAKGGKKEPEVSRGGSSILRHQPRDRDLVAPAYVEAMEEIGQHMERWFGPPGNVFHEIVSDLVHIDVHIIAPTPERNWWSLCTTGMSALPMTVPKGAEKFVHGELVLALPPTWRVDLLGVTPPPDDLERWYWPIRWLKILARLPHEYDTWLGWGHTIPNGDPPRAFTPDTTMCGWLLLSPQTVPEEARTIALADGRTIHLYSMIGLHPSEMDLKLELGTDALVERFERGGLGEVLDPSRAVCID